MQLKICYKKNEKACEGGIIIELRNQLIKEKKRLEDMCKLVSQRLTGAPDGTLRLSKSQGCTQFYHCTRDSGRNGKYIPKRDIELVKQLAQKSYDKKVLEYAEKTIFHLNRLLNDYADKKIEELYTYEHFERQKLIVPVEPTYDQRLSKWMEDDFRGKGFAEGTPIILTNKGLRVRSKSEKILGDYFDSVGLIYKYECPLYLKGYGNVYPDFTFLSQRTGREIYWEHEGMMDNPDYARTAVQKIESYEKNGIFCGENLILTFETSTSVINTELINTMVNRYLLW